MDISSGAIQAGVIRETKEGAASGPAGSRLRRTNPQRPAADVVAISEQAVVLRSLRKAVDDAPEVREEKVSALREAVQEGRYQPTSVEIARAILAYRVSR